MAQIIHKNAAIVDPSWQKELKDAFTDPAALLEFLQLPIAPFQKNIKARKLFPMRVPVPFAQKMKAKDFNDPLLRQVFPLYDEFEAVPGFVTDPLQEQQGAQAGLLHKYKSRVLLIVRGGCAVNCRYCFRRHFPYGDNSPSKNEWLKVLQHIEEDEHVNEVILSGGDPLMAKDDFLSWLVTEIESLKNIEYLRIHTRLPVVIPSRLTEDLTRLLGNSRLHVAMVLHINHANEIDETLSQAVQPFVTTGIRLYNQAVLLKGVNDSVKAQILLAKKSYDAHIQPYYLHLLDKVSGAGHFEVAERDAIGIMQQLIEALPGFMVPKLVREIPGQPSKTPIDLKLSGL